MAVSFAADVVKLFRPKDITCMSSHGVMLDDYAYMSNAAGDGIFGVHANARHVYARLSGAEKPPMPPDGAGRWDAAKLAVFDDWMSDGFLA